MRRINIIIADDHILFIDGLKLLLKDEVDIEIIAMANNGKELLEKLKINNPDIILLDINMPVMNGLETTRYIQQSKPAIKIIFLSTYKEDHLIEKAKQVGARGYLLKDCNKSDLLNSIHIVFNGQSAFPQHVPRAVNQFNEHDQFLKQFNLTKREFEIVQMIKQGLTNQEVADQLFLSIYTIETHRKNIMQKLGIHKPAELIRFMLKNNL